eukprot:1160787-Pelagomonas_calceolata.AAC.4
MQEMDAKAKSTRLDHWLFPNIIVKVMSKELKEAGYYKQKVGKMLSSLVVARCTTLELEGQQALSKELKDAWCGEQKGEGALHFIVTPNICKLCCTFGSHWGSKV